MRYDSFFNYALDDFYRPVAFVSSVIILLFLLVSFAYAAGPVSTEVAAGTTTYKVTSSTVSTPINTALSSAKDITPRVISKLPSGGLSQTVSGNLIVAAKEPWNAPLSRAPLTGSFNVNLSTLKTGAKTLLRAAPAIQAGSLGLQALLDTADWAFGDHGELLKPSTGGDPTDPNYWGSAPVGVTYSGGGIYGSSDLRAVLQAVVSKGIGNAKNGVLVGATNHSPNCLELLTANCSIKPVALDSESRPISQGYYGSVSVSNPSGGVSCASPSDTYNPVRFGCISASQGDFEPVTDDDIEALVDSSYDPQPSDWDDIFPYIEPDTFLVDPIPSIVQNPVTTTSIDNLTGDTTVVEKTTSYDFGLSSNPSARPSVSVKEKTKTDTYKNGSLVGSGSVETEYPSSPDIKPLPSTGGGGGSDFEFPAFCSWASPVCGFIDWFKEEPAEPDDDLSPLLQTIPIVNETYTITGGAAACPAPLVLDLSAFGSREVSYQPLCDLAVTMKFLYLALMSFAAAVLLHRSISRV